MWEKIIFEKNVKAKILPEKMVSGWKCDQRKSRAWFFHNLQNYFDRQRLFGDNLVNTNDVNQAHLMSWKPHLPNFANWASSQQVFTSSSQMWPPRKWKAESGTVECLENICDLIITSLSVRGNATGAWVTQFSYFPLSSHKLWHHFLSNWHHSSQAQWARDVKRKHFFFGEMWIIFLGRKKRDKKCKSTL